MDLTKRYETSFGVKCDILQLVKIEPEWAANIIQMYENEIKSLKENSSECQVDARAMPICPYCEQKMYLTTIEAGNGCGEYSQETIWECGCMSYDLGREIDEKNKY